MCKYIFHRYICATFEVFRQKLWPTGCYTEYMQILRWQLMTAHADFAKSVTPRKQGTLYKKEGRTNQSYH